MNRKKALVIGIDNYNSPDSCLNGCINDAVSISDILSKNQDGSPNFSVRKLLDPKTRSKVVSEITALFSDESDAALLFYSGHGAINDRGAYLVTPDYTSHDCGVSMDEILILANKSQARQKIIILDSCHSGAFGSPFLNGGITANIGDGLTVLTSSRSYEYSLESNDNGIFTNLLLSALEGGAADIIGNITLGGIYSYVDQHLGPWDQRPVFKTNISNFFSVRQVKPVIGKEILRELITFFPVPDSIFELNPSFEPTNKVEVEIIPIAPYANEQNTVTFSKLQKLVQVGIIKPTDAEHMYFAAMESKGCSLTPLGKHYWSLVKAGRI